MYNKKIDGWVGGWKEGRIPNRWMDGRLYKLIYEIIYRWFDEYKNNKNQMNDWIGKQYTI